MRIFLSCQQAQRMHPVPAYAFWEYYFKNALAEAGHEIIETPAADWAEGLKPLQKTERSEWLGRTWGKTVDFLHTEHHLKPVGLFLSYFFPEQVEPSAVRAIRADGIPCVNFFCDNIREFTRVPAAFEGFDLHWVPEAEARFLYKKARLPYLYAPMPVWIRPELRTAPSNENQSVVFIGSRDALREELLGEAVELGLPLQVYGAGWRESGQAPKGPTRSFSRTLGNQVKFLRKEGLRGVAMRASYQFRKRRPDGWIETRALSALGGDAYFQTTREGQVVVGINRYPSFRRPFSNPHRYSRLRDIEAPMLGACYLTEMAPGLEDLFEIGEEIEVYRDAAELVEQAKRLQGDPAKRIRLRHLGQHRALADHSIARSLERIVQKLGGTG